MTDVSTTSSVGASAAVAAAADASADSAKASAEACDSLLPSPDGTANLDAMSLLYLYMTQGRDASAASSRDAVARAKEERSRQWQQIKAALKKAIEASKKSGFWGGLSDVFGKVAKVATLVAAAAATIASMGAAAPVVALAVGALVLSAGAMAQSEFQILQKLGVSDKLASWIELGMVAGAGLCTGGSALLATEESTAATWAQLGQIAATMIGGGSSVVAGGTAIAASSCQSDADEANASAEQGRVFMDQLARQILQLLDDYEESEKSTQRALGGLQGAITTQGDTMVAAARA